MGCIGSLSVPDRGSAGDAGREPAASAADGTYLCEGLSPGAGTYLVFGEKGDYTLYRQSGVLSAGTYAEDANGVYVLKGEGLTVPYVTYDGKDSVHFFSVPDTYTYQRISDIPTYINVEKP